MPRRRHAVTTVLLQALEQRRHLSATLNGDKLVIDTTSAPTNDTLELTLGGNGATIDVQESKVHLRVLLPPMLGMFSSLIQATLQKKGNVLLEDHHKG